ncbi:hypothetical protein F5J12DRAFT_784598 [Pisolithus orientalis]|uniref:uncharacterized protein n=1 Tax=Pisolithus orientalis TaxID=936130 RepID=UPI002224C38C|nr:uncharacterized protein F5J12DRAFT_784598 [Pisolithus orientalis]KAI5999824.1 hypothetical protein F5J12DRAFT_784598 [Pisolithus orientalis]
MSIANTSTFIPAQSPNNIQMVITTENAKWMVEEAARVTPPSNVEPVHGPARGLAISITPPSPAVRSAPGQEDAAIYSILSKCDLQEEVATPAGSCYCMIQILENQSGMVMCTKAVVLQALRANGVMVHLDD